MAQAAQDHAGVRRPVSVVASVALVLALLAALAAAAAGLGYRSGLWPLGTGFAVLRYAIYGGIAAVAAALLGVVLARPGGPRRGLYRAIAGLVMATAVLGVLGNTLRAARAVPPIHDITTDLDDPPAFVAVIPLRGEGAHPVAYGGAKVAAQQRAGYPGIGPVEVELAPARLYDLALATALDMGWEIVAAQPSEGRIEATATTFWFGFKDDVVIRVRAQGSGARLDIRSLSRIGQGDAGTNAARIKAYLAALAL
jgi:uncharacterized protein (DUF1499 family)